MRIAVANFSSRRVGGAESYIEEIIAEFANSGHEVGLFVEYDVPADRLPIRLPGKSPRWCVANQTLAGAIAAMREWHPDLIFAHGLVSPENEAATLSVAPAVFFAHGYYGTCISGAKTNSFPNVVPCTRTFGPKCLLHFYPRRCGGLSPVTALIEYRRQADRLKLLRRYRAILTDSTHMREEYLRHGFDPNMVIRSSYLSDTSAPVDAAIESAYRIATRTATRPAPCTPVVSRTNGCAQGRADPAGFPADSRGCTRPADRTDVRRRRPMSRFVDASRASNQRKRHSRENRIRGMAGTGTHRGTTGFIRFARDAQPVARAIRPSRSRVGIERPAGRGLCRGRNPGLASRRS